MFSGGLKIGERIGIEDVVVHLMAGGDFAEADARALADELDAGDLRGSDGSVQAGFSSGNLYNVIGSALRQRFFDTDKIERAYNALAPILVDESFHEKQGMTPGHLAAYLAEGMNRSQPWLRTSFGHEWSEGEFLPVAEEIARREGRPDREITEEDFSGRSERNAELCEIMQRHFPSENPEVIRDAVAMVFPSYQPAPADEPEVYASAEVPVVKAGVDLSQLVSLIEEVAMSLGVLDCFLSSVYTAIDIGLEDLSSHELRLAQQYRKEMLKDLLDVVRDRGNIEAISTRLSTNFRHFKEYMEHLMSNDQFTRGLDISVRRDLPLKKAEAVKELTRLEAVVNVLRGRGAASGSSSSLPPPSQLLNTLVFALRGESFLNIGFPKDRQDVGALKLIRNARTSIPRVSPTAATARSTASSSASTSGAIQAARGAVRQVTDAARSLDPRMKCALGAVAIAVAIWYFFRHGSGEKESGGHLRRD